MIIHLMTIDCISFLDYVNARIDKLSSEFNKGRANEYMQLKTMYSCSVIKIPKSCLSKI